MTFSYRYRKPISIIALLAILFTGAATPAVAEYAPQLGRFVQRDPNGLAVGLQPGIAYHASNPMVTVSMAYELQFADGMNFYNYLRSDPTGRKDPSGLWSLTETLTTTAIYSTIGIALLAAYGAGRGCVAGYGSGLAPRDIVTSMVLEADSQTNSYEKIGSILLLSAIAATGPVGLAAAGGIAYGFGMYGVYEANGRINEAQNHLDLAIATYDGGASTLVALMGTRAARAGLIRHASIVGTTHSALRPTQLHVSSQRVSFYVEKLLAGVRLDPIEVVRVPGRGRFIVDGHHRYVASRLTGKYVPTSETTSTGPVGFADWTGVTLEP